MFGRSVANRACVVLMVVCGGGSLVDEYLDNNGDGA